MYLDLWVNNKTGNIYEAINYCVTNATNAQDGQNMVFYTDMKGTPYVREYTEFLEKFTKEPGIYMED